MSAVLKQLTGLVFINEDVYSFHDYGTFVFLQIGYKAERNYVLKIINSSPI